MSARICLVTTGQPSTSPRVVKEADALAAEGYDVRVIASHWADWASETDRELLATRTWTAQIIEWRQARAPFLFWTSRARHAAARAATRAGLRGRAILDAAAGRVTPELTRAAVNAAADLYIAHNLGALPAAARAAWRHGSRLGFDAEDFHAGQLAAGDPARARIEAIEARYLPLCDYVTAASPGIAAAYARISRSAPTVVLNVFPLADRPTAPVSHQTGPLRLYWFSQTIGPHRGLEQALAALGLLRDADVQLNVRGSWAAGYEAMFARLAQQAGVSPDRIVRHAPAAPDAMVREAATYDIGLALETGSTENANVALGNKVFTCLLAGLPLLATSTRAHTELAAACGEAMQLVPPGDAAALAAAIRRWHDAPQLLARAKRAAWTAGTDRFNWDRERDTFLSVARDTLRKARPSRGRAQSIAS